MRSRQADSVNDFFSYELNNYVKSDGQEGRPRRVFINSVLADLLDMKKLEQDLGVSAEDISTRVMPDNKVYTVIQTAQRDSTIKASIEAQHDTIMKRNAHVVPLFHARMEMDKLRKKNEAVTSASPELSPMERQDGGYRYAQDAKQRDNEDLDRARQAEEFDYYYETMKKIVEVYRVITSANKKDNDKTVTYQLTQHRSNPLRDVEYEAFKKRTRAQLLADNAFQKLLDQLHRQSKEMFVSQRGAIVGGLMMAFGALMVAAGVAMGLTLGWTGIGLGFGAALTAAGGLTMIGGAAVIKEREHVNKLSRMMNNQFNLFRARVKEVNEQKLENVSSVKASFVIV